MKCLNCKYETDLNYCANCGQKNSTHRFSLRNEFIRDAIEAFFQLNKGFFFTLKALLLHPGHSIRAYIQGQRKPYFNYMGLVLILATISVIISDWAVISWADLYIPPDVGEGKRPDFLDSNPVLKHFKLFNLASIPLYALITKWLFRRAQQNYAEHLVLNAYMTAGVLFITNIFGILVIPSTNTMLCQVAFSIATIVAWAYSSCLYIQYFSDTTYTLLQRTIRSIATIIISFMATMFITAIVFLVIIIFFVDHSS